MYHKINTNNFIYVPMYVLIGNWSLQIVLSIPKGRSDNYGSTGYGVSSPGIKNEKYFYQKINIPNGNY